jgi:hypothetical protein
MGWGLSLFAQDPKAMRVIDVSLWISARADDDATAVAIPTPTVPAMRLRLESDFKSYLRLK